MTVTYEQATLGIAWLWLGVIGGVLCSEWVLHTSPLPRPRERPLRHLLLILAMSWAGPLNIVVSGLMFWLLPASRMNPSPKRQPTHADSLRQWAAAGERYAGTRRMGGPRLEPTGTTWTPSAWAPGTRIVESRWLGLRAQIQYEREQRQIAEGERDRLYSEIRLSDAVVGAAQAFIDAPHCEREVMSFGHEVCTPAGTPCDTHQWHLLRHSLGALRDYRARAARGKG